MENEPKTLEKPTDRRRSLRIRLAEHAMGIPWFRRCEKCLTPISRAGKSGFCLPCFNHFFIRGQKRAPCRDKAIRLYRTGVSTATIARSCEISKERVYQFIRPTGLIGNIVRPTRGKRKLAERKKRFDRMRQRIMNRYAVCRLYRFGMTIPRLRELGFCYPQGVLKAANVPKRRPGQYDRLRCKRAERFTNWDAIANGDFHEVTTQANNINKAYRWGWCRGYKITTRRVRDRVFMVRFTRDNAEVDTYGK